MASETPKPKRTRAASADRKGPADVFRQATFFACSAYANRVYTLSE